MKLKELHKLELPREKLAKYGVQRLLTEELLAIILGSGIKGVNVLSLARSVLKYVEKNNNQPSLKGLEEIKGLGKTKALQIIALLEIAHRLQEKETIEILSAKDVWQHCADFRGSKKEHFVAFYLDTQNRLIERQIISVGTLDRSLVHPREVFEPAIRLSAASVILAHNHPSGEISASSEDIALTSRLLDSANILAIRIRGHIIVSTHGFSEVDVRVY
ncbi:MAG TPA: DNA repair protein RadC [Candidatus Paceibacterota bacterium]|nr:DNA repair protein RadC [Candidatus Paceibacterota bacterium]